MTTYPAPYESPPEDDLRAAVSAGMTVTFALILSWILGFAAYHRISDSVHLLDGGYQPEDLPAEIVVPGVGWGIAVLFLVLGCLPVIRRTGRAAVIFGALISIAVTIIAHASYAYGTIVEQWPLYWGGIAVLALAILPATRRWVHRLSPPSGETVIGTVPPGVTSFGSTTQPPSGTI